MAAVRWNPASHAPGHPPERRCARPLEEVAFKAHERQERQADRESARPTSPATSSGGAVRSLGSLCRAGDRLRPTASRVVAGTGDGDLRLPTSHVPGVPGGAVSHAAAGIRRCNGERGAPRSNLVARGLPVGCWAARATRRRVISDLGQGQLAWYQGPERLSRREVSHMGKAYLAAALVETRLRETVVGRATPGALHAYVPDVQQWLVAGMRADAKTEPVKSAGSRQRLAPLGDPRFRADAWYLPDEPLLGFVEIPAGPFLMGSDPSQDHNARI